MIQELIPVYVKDLIMVCADPWQQAEIWTVVARGGSTGLKSESGLVPNCPVSNVWPDHANTRTKNPCLSMWRNPLHSNLGLVWYQGRHGLTCHVTGAGPTTWSPVCFASSIAYSSQLRAEQLKWKQLKQLDSRQLALGPAHTAGLCQASGRSPDFDKYTAVTRSALRQSSQAVMVYGLTNGSRIYHLCIKKIKKATNGTLFWALNSIISA